jgi:putative phosphoesterase
MYIGLISDTHGVFSEEFRKFLEPVDEIWHAGDFGGGMELAEKIAEFKPLTGVAGNCDNHNLRFIHPLHRFFECEGLKILMTHIGGYPGRYDVRARELIDRYRPDIFVCGHSHILKVMRDDKRNMLTINPGAAGIQGFHVVRTALRFKLEDGKIHSMEVFELDR